MTTTAKRQPVDASHFSYRFWYVRHDNHQDLENVLVVVTRWYGGVLLGPDRFKHINRAARDALTRAGLVDAPAGANSRVAKR